jgi:hypothetical protein
MKHRLSRLSVYRNKPTTASWLSLACGAALCLGMSTISQANNPPPQSTVTITGSPLGVELGCGSDWNPACVVGGVPTPSLNGLVRRSKDAYWVRTFNLTGGIGYQYKVIVDAVLNLTNFNNAWKENYGFGGQQDGPNIPLNVPGIGSVPVTFYYNELTNLIVDSVNTPIVVLSQGSFQQAMGCPSGNADPDCFKTLMSDIAKTGSVILKVPATAVPAGTNINGIKMAVYNPGLGTYDLVTPVPDTLTMPNVQNAKRFVTQSSTD